MANKFMYIPNDDTQNYFLYVDFNSGWLKRLDTQLNQPIKIQYRFPKLLSQRIGKRYYKT